MLAHLIVSNWTTETVPQLTALIDYHEATGWRVHLMTQRLHVVEMSEPEGTVFQGDQRTEQTIEWVPLGSRTRR